MMSLTELGDVFAYSREHADTVRLLVAIDLLAEGFEARYVDGDEFRCRALLVEALSLCLLDADDALGRMPLVRGLEERLGLRRVEGRARTSFEPSEVTSRVKDRHLQVVLEWRGGCVYCGAVAVGLSLPGSGGQLTMPLCARHVRWAMAARRERVGKQARNLKKLLLAWARLHGGDREAVARWLEY